MPGNLGAADGSESEKELADDEEEEEEEEERDSDEDSDHSPQPTSNILLISPAKKPTPQSSQPDDADDSATGNTVDTMSCHLLTVIRV